MSFLAEMSFLALLGIGLGLGLGIISSIQLIDEMRLDEPEVEFVLPWVKVILISVGAYLSRFLPRSCPLARPLQSRPQKPSDTSRLGGFCAAAGEALAAESGYPEQI